ncbi:sodium-dependent multivitamin transporter-like [Mytilus edulis]|uniref:sodium-dependent multivitamin transporter-like n=1 Tax=Mytilus edulis TaxID=6550 RepID=UPI0039EFBDBC
MTKMMQADHPGFVVADYAVFAVTIIISLGIGIYYAFSGGKQKTTSEYLVGNRQMSILPVALSLMVSFESSIMMLGFPGEVYSYGIMFWLSNAGFMIALLLGTRIVVPLVHPLRIKSVFEYFELKYKGREVRLLGTTIGMLGYVFYMGIVLFGPGTALEAVTDMPYWVSVACVALASVIYTSIGGIKAVIWTDVFQCLIMFMGIFAVLIKGTISAGGPKRVFDLNAENGRLYLFNFDTDPTVRHTFWGLVIGSCLRLISLSFNQSTVQRISSMSTQAKARKVMFLTAPAFFVTLSLATLEGVVAYAYYTSIRCDPLTSKRIQNPNQIIPYMVLDIFRNLPGMSGLFMASLFSASLSTMSSGLSSLSAMTVEDYIKPFHNLSDKKLTAIAKLSVPFYGLLSVAVSFMIAEIPGPMSQITTSILSAFGGPSCGLFLYTVFFPWSTKKGALIGTTASVILSFWLSAGKNFSKTLQRSPWATMPPTDQCYLFQNTSHFINYTITTEYTTYQTTEAIMDHQHEGLDKFYALSYQWVGVLGILYMLVIGIITSCIEGLPKSKDIDVIYVLSFFDQFFPFLPKNLRTKLYLGVPFEKREELLKKVDKGFMDYEAELLPTADTELEEKDEMSSKLEVSRNGHSDDDETAKDNDV